jgi:hypothetical protein
MDAAAGICFLTGQKLSLGSPFRDGFLPVLDHLDDAWGDGPYPVLHLTGQNATSVVSVTCEFNAFVQASPVWVDVLGMPNPG